MRPAKHHQIVKKHQQVVNLGKVMANEFIHWTDETVEKLAQHDVTPEDFRAAFDNRVKNVKSRSSGRSAFIGYDDRGRKLFCVFHKLTDMDIEPVTAYEIE
jgi:hypothetical protein